MSTSDKDDLSQLIENAKTKYIEYATTQKDFQAPQAHISIETESTDVTRVHMEVQHKETLYYFESVQEKDINDIYQYLNSQPSVRAKYANGNTTTLEATTTRVNTLVNRFRNKTSPLYLYSGFIVSDAQTETFLGLVNLGGGSEVGTAEMARLNRPECWSYSNNVADGNTNSIHTKTYSGVGTVETSTLLQYAARLKQEGYTVNGHPLKAVVATARTDNEGSWKSSAKAGMTLQTAETVDRYGPILRYQLRKNM